MKLISFQSVFVLLGVLFITVMWTCPDIIGTAQQPNGIWMIIALNIFLFIFINMFNLIYLNSRTALAPGINPMTFDGTITKNGLWAFINAGDSIRSAGYDTSKDGVGGLQKVGRDMVCAMGTHCHEVGGKKGSPKRHLIITAQSEEFDPSYCPLGLKNIRDQFRKRVERVYMGFFSSKELLKFEEFTYQTTDGTDHTINISSIIQDITLLYMELDMYLASLQGNPEFIKGRLEGFNTLLKVSKPEGGWLSKLSRDRREVDET